MTVQPPDWAIAVPSAPGIHTAPARSYQWQSLSADQQRALWENLIQSVVQQVMLTIEGFLLPGNALNQLFSWASGIPIIGDFVNAITGSSTTGGGGYAGLNSWFNDLLSLFGPLLGLGTGSPTSTSTATSIPLLHTALMSGSAFKTPLIPDITIPMSSGIQDTIDKVYQAATGLSTTGNLITDLYTAMQHQLSTNVLGIAGPADIGASIQAGWDQLVSGFVGSLGTGSSLADMYNVPYTIASHAALGALGWDILGIRNNKPMDHGLLATSESNVSLSKIGLQSSASTFAVTSTASTIAYQRISESVDKGVVSWLGYGNTGITDFRIVIWQMDITSGALTSVVHTSTNQAGLLASGSTPQWAVYSLPSTVHVEPGEVYGIELCSVGGTHNVVGQSTWLPDHPSSYPKSLAASRNSGTTFPPTAPITPASSANVPFVEFGVAVSGTPAPHSPETRLFNTAGSTTTIIPSWSNYIDLIGVGDAGGGGGIITFAGAGGLGGSWNGVTLTRGSTIPTGTAILNISIGGGGTGGAAGVSGTAGSGVTVTATGMTTFTAAAGSGGAAGGATGGVTSTGKSPGNYTYNSVLYVGGVVQNTASTAGNAPGGGGSGATIGTKSGGHGAVGSLWVVFRQ